MCFLSRKDCSTVVYANTWRSNYVILGLNDTMENLLAAALEKIEADSQWKTNLVCCCLYNHLGIDDGISPSASRTFHFKEISKSNVVGDMHLILENILRACIGLAPENNVILEYK
ncbi:hypothetical protein CISIN_1g045499mg [Citrus sinensis]|uniref:Uncharacterized protein n=1 Tax=Citrus sinensis TaxID=2711 RepID=A0A067E718_CITSI|nr:hypothetical protein CISIN_1g045499mg [Citrus sinensis]